MQFQFSRFSTFVAEILHEICDAPHWLHLKRSIMMGHKPSNIESDFTHIFSRLKSLCKHDIPEPVVHQIEMSPVFGHKESYNLTTPQSDSIVAVEEAKQYSYGKKASCLSLTCLPIGYSSNRFPCKIQCNSSSNRSPYRIQCNSSSNKSPYRIQCNSSSNRPPYRIQCNSSSNRSPYRIQCNSSSNRSPYRIQCNSSSNRSPYRIQCNSSSNRPPYRIQYCVQILIILTSQMDYATFKVVSEILDSSGKWDVFADSLKLAGVFELSRMQRRYSMMSHGNEILSRALSQHSVEDITTTLKQLDLNLAVDIIEKRANPQDF